MTPEVARIFALLPRSGKPGWRRGRLPPRRQQSGEIDRMGGISKCGDAMMREMLFEAALVLMTHSRWTREEAAAT
jgi:transposase